jgi:ribosomal protein S18 acetylase RimI-like enzyme
VQLSVVASNESAMKIYRDLGFEEIARICYYRWMKEP